MQQATEPESRKDDASIDRPTSSDATADEAVACQVEDTAGKMLVVLLDPATKPSVDELNSAGASLLRTNVSAFNKLRENYLEWRPDFQGGDFEEANLEGVNLSGANLQEARLISANLKNSNLSGGNFSNAQISSADLTNADLRNARFNGADLGDSKLNGADIRGANMGTGMDSGYLKEVIDETGKPIRVLTLLGVKYDSATILQRITNPGIQSTFYIAGEEVSAESLLALLKT